MIVISLANTQEEGWGRKSCWEVWVAPDFSWHKEDMHYPFARFQHEPYLSETVRGSHSKSFTALIGFPLGGLSAKVKDSVEVLLPPPQRQPACFTTTGVPKHPSQPVLVTSVCPLLKFGFITAADCAMPLDAYEPGPLSGQMLGNATISPSLQRPWGSSVSCIFHPSNHPFLGIPPSCWPQHYSPSMQASCMPLRSWWPRLMPKVLSATHCLHKAAQ